MLKCSKEAFSLCPTRHLCGLREDALFIEGSDCDRFNQQVRNRPMTNADRIRAMSDKELAEFLAKKLTDNEQVKAHTEGRTMTATELSAIAHLWFVSWMQWLRQYVEEE